MTSFIIGGSCFLGIRLRSDPLSRHELGVLIARPDGLDASRLPRALKVESTVPGVLDVRLDSRMSPRSLRTRLRGAREFLRTRED